MTPASSHVDFLGHLSKTHWSVYVYCPSVSPETLFISMFFSRTTLQFFLLPCKFCLSYNILSRLNPVHITKYQIDILYSFYWNVSNLHEFYCLFWGTHFITQVLKRHPFNHFFYRMEDRMTSMTFLRMFMMPLEIFTFLHLKV